LRQLYDYLPYSLQNFLIGFEGRKRNRVRFGEGFEQVFQNYMERSFWTQEKTEDFQKRRLGGFLSAVFNCPPQEALEKFAQLGIMAKPDARRYFKEGLPRQLLREHHTSGTTGEGMFFYTTLQSEQEQWAVWWRHRTWHDIPRDEWSCYFGGRKIVPLRQQKSPFWRINRPGRQLIFSNYHLDKTNAPHYLKKLKESGHRWIHGYPSSISLLASYALDLGIQVPMKWITTSAENLMPYQAKLIERAFGVKPIQHYGLAEGVANISQCPAGKLHVDEDFSRVEFIPTGYGENIHHIVGTNFTNPVFPLLRYNTGDLATLIPGDSCDCGRPGRVVHSLDGRLQDFVVTKSGKYLSLLDPIFSDCENIQRAQIRQDRPGSMTILVIRGAAYGPKDEAHLANQTWVILGDEMDFEIEYVEDIPTTNTGKHRLVVSTIG
jgi:phenylacetate-CoA ligase